jgi:hypothetical protein
MAALSLAVRHNRTDEQGRAPVRLRISHRGTRRFIPLDVRVDPRRWNGGREVVQRSHPEAPHINQYLQNVKAKAQAALTRLKTRGEIITAQRVREAVDAALRPAEERGEQNEQNNFLKFFKREVEAYRRRGKHGTYKNHLSVYRKFVEFFEVHDDRELLPYADVTPALIRAFRTFCYEVRGNATNTVGKSLNILRTHVRSAMKEGHISRADYPFEFIIIDSEPVQ